MQITLSNGRRLFLESASKGAPTIVLEAGAGSASSTWDHIWPGVATMTRVCRYDRPGLGRSDPAASPRTAGDVAEELHQLLTAAYISGPYILVGPRGACRTALCTPASRAGGGSGPDRFLPP